MTWDLTDQIQKIHQKEGVVSLVRRTRSYVRRNVLVPYFGLYDRLTDPERRNVMIVLRGSTLDPDSLDLVERISPEINEGTMYVVVKTKEVYDQTDPLAIEEKYDVEILQEGSRQFVAALLRTDVLFCKDRGSIRPYRRAGESDARLCVRLYHGIVTKAYGNLMQERIESAHPRKTELATLRKDFDVQPVSSDVELFFRSCAEGRHPVAFKKYGHPRFDRLYDIREGRTEPILPEQTHEVFESTASTTRILYAPTHKDENVTTLFPFPEFDCEALRTFLAANDMTLFIRMHPEEEKESHYEEYIDGEHIRYAGQRFSTASSEILGFFDLLVTDYSSIYVDFLPFDNPILFVKDGSFSDRRGLAYDYEKYFPGKKVETYEEFTEWILKETADPSAFEADRAFVTEVFGLKNEPTFFEQLSQEFGSERYDSCDRKTETPAAGSNKEKPDEQRPNETTATRTEEGDQR